MRRLGPFIMRSISQPPVLRKRTIRRSATAKKMMFSTVIQIRLVSPAMLFFSSSALGAATGQNLVIDGGRVML